VAIYCPCVNRRLTSYDCRVEPPRRHNDDNYNFSLNSTYDTVSLQPESSTNLPTEDLLQESLLEDNIDPRNELEELLDNFLEKHSDFDAALGSWELLVDSQKASEALKSLSATHLNTLADRTLVPITSTTYFLNSRG